MKALEILEYAVVILNNVSDIKAKEYKEAIEELKTLQANYEAQEIIIADLKKQLEPKTCEGCNYSLDDKPYSKSETCLACIRNTIIAFDYYEPKDKE